MPTLQDRLLNRRVTHLVSIMWTITADVVKFSDRETTTSLKKLLVVNGTFLSNYLPYSPNL